jgi:non-specific serine/threonine protein kinase
MDPSAVSRIGRFKITRMIGEGGMGTVYAGYDDRLDRPIAIKVVRNEALRDTTARERFRREARAAARVSHPHICPLYEFDEDQSQQFLVMELLEGETLAARLERGPIPPEEALSMAATILDALAALHRCGIIHRDLKPANVFLTPHGPRLLDFGLAQPPAGEHTREARLTGRGVLIGTPQYMAPEQLHGKDADERADIFAAAAVIYQMLSGRPAFGGATLPEIIHAVGYVDPPPLVSFTGAAAIDRVLRRAFKKDPAERLDRVDALASQLREAAQTTATETQIALPDVTRFVALPLRILRADPETDFLAFSVPDAVSSALANLESVIVCVPPGGVAADADVRAIGRDLSVDVVLTGTILRAGAHVRLTAQLTDGAGTLRWSDTAQAPIADLFQLQDTLTSRIVSSLSLPLAARDRRALDKQAPANAEAYALFMRANQMMTDTAQWDGARVLYERAVGLDPNYAPAWAGLGRARRVMAKWGGPAGIGLLPHAESAFRRALEIDPDLSSAHDLSAYVDAELGRAPEAVARLLRRAATHRTDPGLYAGLVTSCRYAGLFTAAIAAHHRATAMDPTLLTSVSWAHFMLGDYRSAIATDLGALPFAAVLSQLICGESDVSALAPVEAQARSPGTRLAIRAYREVFEGNTDAARRTLDDLRATGFADPEGWYLYAFAFARLQRPDLALDLLARSIQGGYGCHAPLVREPAWKAIRGNAYFDALVARAGALVDRARQVYDDAGGTSLLG